MATKIFCNSYCSSKYTYFRLRIPISFKMANSFLSTTPETPSTVDAKDVYRHSQQMKTWWDYNGPMTLLHKLNHLRVPFIRDAIVQISPNDKFSTSLKGQKILDIGCGGGILSEALSRCGAEVTGIDASKDLIEMAQYHSSRNKNLSNNLPKYLCTTIEEHCTNYTENYDAVVASEVIEHVVEKELFVESCVRATKPGGRLFFTTPSKTRASQYYVIWFSETILKLIPRGTHEYEKFMRPNELQYMLEMNDCFVELVKGYSFYPFAKHWDWINSKMFFFAMQAVKSNKN